MNSQFLMLVVVFNLLAGITTANAQDSLRNRTYRFVAFNQYDLRTSSINFTSTHQLINDLMREKVKPSMGEKAGNITVGLFSFASTYLSMLWSHEMGHFLRARQVGGEFRIHNAGLPIPYTTMHLPDDINLIDEALSVTAGFEVNYLTVRRIQQDFISQDGAFNEDLAYAFANRLMYPLYTTVIVPIDPSDTTVWIKTAGDPVHITLPVFEHYSDGKVFMSDRSVNPDLVSFYNQSAILATFINLLDPQFYREVGASFGKNKARKPIFLIGDHDTGWTYGTLFNPSPLGYEVYMNNYLHVNDCQFSMYVKYGNPYKNNGIGFGWYDMLSSEKFYLSTNIDVWDQDLFGTGLSAELELLTKFTGKLGSSINLGYKTEGYLLGKQLDQGFNLGLGITYHSNY